MISRREFLYRSFFLTLSSALAACSTREAVSPPTAANIPATLTSSPLPTTTLAPTASAVPTAAATMTAAPSAPAASQAYLAIARGPSPAAITRAAVDALGGMRRFVKAGDDVIVKPNICTAALKFEYGATTNPEVVAAVVQMCLDAGAKRVRVMDQPFSGTAVEAYKNCGIREAVERAGGQMEVMSTMKYVETPFPNGRNIKKWNVYQDILKADVVINVPVAKTHDSAKLTLAMKGLMGVITDRSSIHNSIDQRIADLSTVIKPTLNIVDAVRVVTRGGPTTWNLNDVVLTNAVIATHDIVAADAYAAETLFKRKPADIGYIRMGAEMGLGKIDLAGLDIRQVTV